MRCHICGKTMKYAKGMQFNGYLIDWWKCICGERYYEPEQAERILLPNKLKKEALRSKSLIPQRLNGPKLRGLPRGKDAGEGSHQKREHDAADYQRKGKDRLKRAKS